jgi:hypothetical protein
MNQIPESTRIVEELNRITRCIDFRHDRNFRTSSTAVIDNLDMARHIVGAHGLKSFGAIESLNAANVALDAMREDLDCLDSNLRRSFGDNIDDAQDTVRTLIWMAA